MFLQKLLPAAGCYLDFPPPLQSQSQTEKGGFVVRRHAQGPAVRLLCFLKIPGVEIEVAEIYQACHLLRLTTQNLQIRLFRLIVVAALV